VKGIVYTGDTQESRVPLCTRSQGARVRGFGSFNSTRSVRGDGSAVALPEVPLDGALGHDGRDGTLVGGPATGEPPATTVVDDGARLHVARGVTVAVVVAGEAHGERGDELERRGGNDHPERGAVHDAGARVGQAAVRGHEQSQVDAKGNNRDEEREEREDGSENSQNEVRADSE